jgi:hypothetical protein
MTARGPQPRSVAMQQNARNGGRSRRSVDAAGNAAPDAKPTAGDAEMAFTAADRCLPIGYAVAGGPAGW